MQKKPTKKTSIEEKRDHMPSTNWLLNECFLNMAENTYQGKEKKQIFNERKKILEVVKKLL